MVIQVYVVYMVYYKYKTESSVPTFIAADGQRPRPDRPQHPAWPRPRRPLVQRVQADLRPQGHLRVEQGARRDKEGEVGGAKGAL